MLASWVLSRVSRSVCKSSMLLSPSEKRHLPILSTHFHSLVSEPQRKLAPRQVSPFDHTKLNYSTLQRFGFFSTASPKTNDKENGASLGSKGASSNAELGQAEVSDSEAEGDMSSGDLAELVAEKNELLKVKDKEIEEMKDKVLRTYAEMENVMGRTRREAENSKKFAIQSFAKGLLDVADNLGRASSVVKESFSKIDTSKDTSGAVPLLKTLLEGVEMTEKQLIEAFRKFGVEKYDPTNEPFDPNRHNAVFQVPDNSKPPGTVAVVLKSGYVLYDRVIRPAEVGVTKETER